MLFRFSSLVWALCAVGVVNAQSAYPITGVKVDAGAAIPLRKNINALQSTGGPQWDLYIRSLVEMHKQDPKDQLSFFQVAGIHGKPYIEWNGAGKRTSNGWQGYCPHGENLFLPWHRPYLVLYEQRLVATATKLANQYPSKYRAQYQKAAKTLRAPFWDWAASPNVPACTVPTKVTVKVPNGSGLRSATFDNPLRFYKFPKAALDGKFGTFDTGAQIYKCRNPQTYPGSANQAMARRSYKQWVYDAFTRSTTYNQFASTSSTGVSLEQIHNAVHWDGSCGYQFLDADFSAFDPLFMLHHANVDRLWAYWQAMRPGQAGFTGSYSGDARFSSRSGTTITPNSPLHPFYASAGKFHTPKSVQSIKSFGYTYEGLEWRSKSDAQMKQSATALINRLYATGVNKPSRKRDVDATTRYFAQIKVDVEELERPCSVNLYINTTSVASLVVMKQPSAGLVMGKFALDKAADPIDLAGEATKLVVEDILSTIRVEIVKHDGTLIPVTSVPSLKIELENVDLVPPESEFELPEYKDPEQRTAPKKEVKTPGSLANLF
ncbi:hypothetical protein QQZ08_001327 [Neonectria magnoliae]|uniref:tyrosinase n=1 Tax=Neonectria magnoliae TaxID=2732573 RepID=A0ABR1IG95_9HYPO